MASGIDFDEDKGMSGFSMRTLMGLPEGNQDEFMAIGVYGQWIYVNPSKHALENEIIVDGVVEQRYWIELDG